MGLTDAGSIPAASTSFLRYNIGAGNYQIIVGGLQIAIKRLQKPKGQQVEARVAEMNTRNARVHLFARSVYFGVAPARKRVRADRRAHVGAAS
jgi:hypothetical protein